MERQRNGAGMFFIPVILIVVLLFYMLNSMGQQNTLSYQTFQKMVDNGDISSVEIYQNREIPTGRLTLHDTDGNVAYVNVTDVNEATELLEQKDIDYTVRPVAQENIFIRYVMPALLIGIVLLLGFSLMTRSLSGAGGGGNNRMMNFERATRIFPRKTIRRFCFGMWPDWRKKKRIWRKWWIS